VPPRPTSVTPADERKKIEEALISDRQHARYIEEPSAPRAEPLPGADVRAAPRPPVTEGGPIPPPPPAAAQTPAPSGSSGLAQAQPRRPAPPPNVPPPPAAAPAAPAAAPPASSTAGSLRSLGRLVIGPSGEVKQALPSDNGAAEQPPSPGAPPNDGTQPVAVVLFNDGATRISPQQRQGLKAVVDEANARGGTVRIVGHASPARDTNSTAGLVANYKVAWDRAQSVADALAKSGIAAERVHVEADTSPNSAPPVANLPAGDAALRRADIFLQ
jgi:outer membrane protein OmpA-like peptidoglycan-associated protein